MASIDSGTVASVYDQPGSSVLGKVDGLLARYGAIAMVIYLVIFVLVFAGFTVAIAHGLEVDGVASGAGTLGAAWLATKLTQPLRIGATLLLTPAAARLLRRRGGTVAQPPRPPRSSDDD